MTTNTTTSNNFYVYGHYRADTDELFYIGKGSKKRAWDAYKRNPHWKNVVHKHDYVVKILYDNLTEEDAYTKEAELIDEAGLVNLTNMTEGGLGMSSEQARRLAIQRNLSPAYWENMMEGVRRRCANPEWQKNQVIKNQKLATDPIWKQRVNDGRRELMEDPERYAQWIEKKSKATQRLLLTPEYKKKLEDTKEHVKKKAVLISPTGEIVYMHGVKKFAREYGLDYTRVARLVRGESKSHKGWRLHTSPDNNHLINQFTL